MNIKRIEDKLLDPQPGSKAAAAKEFGIDLTLLIRQLKMTPQQRIDELQREMIAIEEFERQAKLSRQRLKAKRPQ